jgi:hypothetical protein
MDETKQEAKADEGQVPDDRHQDVHGTGRTGIGIDDRDGQGVADKANGIV